MNFQENSLNAAWVMVWAKSEMSQDEQQIVYKFDFVSYITDSMNCI